MPIPPPPTEIQFGRYQLEIPEDITAEESAHLSVVLAFASTGCLQGISDTDIYTWIDGMGISRLFTEVLDNKKNNLIL